MTAAKVRCGSCYSIRTQKATGGSAGCAVDPRSIQTMDTLRRLIAAHRCFALRLYDAMPTFRIVLVDQAMVGFSPYLMEEGTEGADRLGGTADHPGPYGALAAGAHVRDAV